MKNAVAISLSLFVAYTTLPSAVLAEDLLQVPDWAIKLNCSLVKINTDIATGGEEKFFALIQFQGEIPIPASLDLSAAEDFWLDDTKQYLRVTALADIQTSAGIQRVVDNVIIMHEKGSPAIAVGMSEFNEIWVRTGDALGYEFENETTYLDSIFDKLLGCYLIP